MRIVYVSCFLDSWANPIAYDIAKTLESHDAEFYFIAEKEKIPDPRINYIDIEKGFFEIKFPDIFNEQIYNFDGVKKLQGLEKQWQQIEQPKVNFEKGYLDRMVMKWFWEAVMSLKIIQPDLGIVFNGNIGRRGAYAEAFKYLNIPFVYAEKGMLPDSWYMDKNGINVEASWVSEIKNLSVSDSQIEKLIKKINEIDKKGNSAWEQPQRKKLSDLRSDLKIGSDQKIIFFPGQVDSDTNILKFSPYFDNSGSALTWLRDGITNKKYFLLVKPHPKGSFSAEYYKNILKDKGEVVDFNVLDAIELADAIVTINSTVAFEAAIRQKPSLLLGGSVLSQQDFVKNYQVGVSAEHQLDSLIQDYDRNKLVYLNKAYSFAVNLDSHVYCYRGDHGSVSKSLSKYIESVSVETKKVFTREEVMSLMTIPKPIQFIDHFNKKALLEIFSLKINKVLKRILRKR